MEKQINDAAVELQNKAQETATEEVVKAEEIADSELEGIAGGRGTPQPRVAVYENTPKIRDKV
jgi:hypothetical protein